MDRIYQEQNNVKLYQSAYDEKINISKEKKAGRVLYDKKKELSKTFVTSKVTMIDNSTNNIPQSEQNLNPNVNNLKIFKKMHLPSMVLNFPTQQVLISV
ncbi:hypothetical protein IJ670_06080 [bacterium]|nr:hypothetical protein [bacterium]